MVAAGASVIVFLKAGRHTVEMTGGSLFDVSRVVPKAGRRLIVAGAGMYESTLVTRTHGNDVIHAHRKPSEPMWRRVSFENLTFARERHTTTQGRLTAVDARGIEIELSAGFPPLGDVLQDIELPPSLWFRRYLVAGDATGHVDAAPRLVVDAYNNSYWKPLVNQQVPFVCCGNTSAGGACPRNASAGAGVCPEVVQLPGSGRRWRLSVSKWPVWPPGELQRYRDAVRDPRQRVAIKVKQGGQAYRMQAGDDVAFVNVRWLGHSRGAIIDTSNVLFRDTRVDRMPPPAAGSEVPLLATNAGGPQILGNGCPVFNVTVVNHTSTATGDDSLALFNVRTGLVAGCRIGDAFGRGIVVCASGGVRLSGNELTRNALFRVNATSYATCLCTSNPHAGPDLPQCVYPN
eukprot:g89.t1